MSLRKQHAEQTRRLLIETALVVFSEKGFNSTRLEDIASRAGVTRGAFYWHFKNKADVFCQLYESIMIEFIDKMERAVNRVENAPDKLHEIFNAVIVPLANDEKTLQSARLFYASEYSPQVVSKLREIRRRLLMRVKKLFKEMIEEGKARGELQKDLDTENILFALMSLIRGMTTQIIDGLLDIKEKNIQSVASIFINGMKPSEQ